MQFTLLSRHFNRYLLLASLALAFILFPGTTPAVTDIPPDLTIPSVPTPFIVDDVLNVGVAGSGTVTQTGTAVAVDQLNLGPAPGFTGTYLLQGGTIRDQGGFLPGPNVTVGVSGTGIFIQTGGDHALNGLILGQNAGSSGTYNLSGAGSLFNLAADLIVGQAGTGLFVQNGVNPAVGGNIFLGETATGAGTYNLLNGNLSPQNLDVGQAGLGTFNQSPGTALTLQWLFINSQAGTSVFNQIGGATSVANHLGVGRDPGSRAEYNLQSGTLDTGDLFVGYQGTGTFTQTGGTHTVANNIYIGEDFLAGQYTGSGTYNLQVGELRAANPAAGTLRAGNLGLGTFNQSPGTTLAVAWLFVDSQAGTSVFNQIGGTTTVANHLGVGRDRGSRAVYNLQSGSLTSGDLFVGHEGTGIFTQTGGSHAVNGDVWLGGAPPGNGTYDLRNGTLTSNRTFVGAEGTGTFWHSGGTHTVNTDLAVGAAAGSSGAYDLGGTGSLVVTGNAAVGYAGTGSFIQRAGTHTVGVDLALGFAPNSSGRYELQNGSLQVSGRQAVGHNGTGVFIQSGGSNATGGDLAVGYLTGGQGTYTQTGGANTVTGSLFLGLSNGSQGTYQLSDLNSPAQLTAHYIGIGFNGGTGAFTQDGGTTTVSTFLTMSDTVGSSAIYTLQRGALSANYADIGWAGPATFIQNGGSHTLAQSLNLGWTVTGVGLYNMTGGTLHSAGSAVYLGYEGQGTFTQSGGAHTLTRDLTLGFEGTGAGRYDLSNTGSLEVNGSEGIGLRGAGVFNQTGGTHTVRGLGLGLGLDTTGNGTFNLSGGSLAVTNNVGVGIFGTGLFTQTGGTHTVSQALYVGGAEYQGLVGTGTGTYELSQTGNLAVSGNLVVGFSSTGVFTQTGGTATVNNALILAQRAGSSGTFNLNGGSLTAAAITVNPGGLFRRTGGNLNFTTLNLPGGTFQGDLVVNPLAAVTGNGFFQGNLDNRGRVNPGNSPGTLNIAGSYTQAAAGTYVLEIASATAYDHLNVTGNPGTATVSGILQPVLLGGYRPSRSQVFTNILTASGGLTGRFTGINSPLNWQVIYHPNSIDLMAAMYRNFADPNLGLTANQMRVGLMLNGVADTAAADLAGVLDTLTRMPDSQMGQAYQQIGPDKAAALPALSLTGAVMQWQNLSNRLSYQRWSRGALPGLAAGRSGSFNLSYHSLAGLMLAYNGADLAGLITAPRPPAGDVGPWGLYTDFVSTLGSQDSTPNMTGYNFTIFGFNVGADYRLAADLTVGLGTGYYNTSASYQGSGGRTGIDSIPFSAYGAYTPGSFYAMGCLGYTLNLYSMNRTLAFGGLSRTANSSPSGNQFNASLETGYDVRLAQFTVTPAFSLFYSQAWVNGFTESGAGALNLSVGSQSADSLQTGLGLRLTRPFRSGTTLFLPQISAFYQHEFANNSRGLDARLAQAGSTFIFQTDSPSRDYAVLGAGLAVGLNPNLTLNASYNAEVGRQNYTAHFINAGLRYTF